MKLLIIGGTIFLGRHIIEVALRQGHEVWCFNRGQSGPPPPPGCHIIHGNRENVDDLKKLSNLQFDAIIDTCGYVPRVVRIGLEALQPLASQYIFASTISVYAPAKPHSNETSPTLSLGDHKSEDVQRHYGELKAECEREVRKYFPKNNTIVRLGFLVGPYDRIYRFPYWVERFIKGGKVIAPGNPADAFQYIDIRDAADWMLLSAQKKILGDYNITGEVIPLGELLDTTNQVLGAKAQLHWIPRPFLISEGITSFEELPYNMSEEDRETVQKSVAKAISTGLKFRGITETAQDTGNWLAKEGFNGHRPFGVKLKPGITRERELAILDDFNNINTIRK